MDNKPKSTWGGPGRGGGRHATGRKPVSFYITDQEKPEMIAFLWNKLRGQEVPKKRDYFET